MTQEKKLCENLQKAIPVRVKFDPKKKAHRASLKTFLETGRWGDVLFVPEAPHIEVPMTVLSKLAAHNLGITAPAKL